MKKKLKHFRARLLCTWRVLWAEQRFVVTRNRGKISVSMCFDVDGKVLDEALDNACVAMSMRVEKEKFEEAGKYTVKEAKDILRRASGEA